MTDADRDPSRTIESLIFTIQSLSLQTSSGPACTPRWASPQLLNGEQPTLASDVWALGWVFWEVSFDFHTVGQGAFLHQHDTHHLALDRL